MKRPSDLPRYAIALMLVTTSGCSLLSNAIKDTANERHDDEIAELEAQDKYEALGELCSANKRGACDAKDRVAAARLAGSQCDDLEANVRAYYNNHAGTKEGDTALVGRFEQCKKLPALFAQDFRIRWLSEALTNVDQEGGEVFDPFVAYVEDGGMKTLPAIDANRWTRWLVAVGDASRCAPLDTHWGEVGEDGRGELLWAYYELGCADQAVPRARAEVTSDRSTRRGQACDVLGKYGETADIEALDILAQGDPHRAEREVQASNGSVFIDVYYPVRERCGGAASKLRLRASTAQAPEREPAGG